MKTQKFTSQIVTEFSKKTLEKKGSIGSCSEQKGKNVVFTNNELFI